MEIKEVIGDNTPQRFEKLQGGTLLNTDVQEVLIEDVTKYKYKQVFVTETNEEKLEKLYTGLMCEVYVIYLKKTDHKFYNGYKPKEGEDLVEIERLRDEAREFIRANEGYELEEYLWTL